MRYFCFVAYPALTAVFIKSLAELGAKCALLYLAKDNIRAIVKTDDDALLLWGSLRCVRRL